MLPLDPPARMAPLEADQFSDEARQMFARWRVGPFKDADTNPPLKTFAHNPRLADLFSQLNIHLLVTSTLSVRHRQIAIMRTAWVCKAKYMWSSHLLTSQNFGLETSLFKPLQVGANDPYFTEFERILIIATEELIADKFISEASWQALMAEWTNEQMLDFMFTVGAYVLTAGAMRSIGVERQPDLIALAEQYGASE